MTVNKITNAPTPNEQIDKINEIIDNLSSSSITVDSELSSSSTNPVKNSVITNALSNKADDNSVVHKANSETISGVKTFSNSITVSQSHIYMDKPSGLTGNTTLPAIKYRYGNNEIWIEQTGTRQLTLSAKQKNTDQLGIVTYTDADLSVPNFYGQWTLSFLDLSHSKNKGKYSFNLGTTGTSPLNYLPADCTTYRYEIMIKCSLHSTSETHLNFANTDVLSTTQRDNDSTALAWICTSSTAGWSQLNTVIPLTTSGMLYTAVCKNNASSSIGVNLMGYRRIGTNT